jgi:hypothetical protein
LLKNTLGILEKIKHEIQIERELRVTAEKNSLEEQMRTKRVLQDIAIERKMRVRAETLAKANDVRHKKHYFLVNVLDDGMTSTGLVELCIAAGFVECATPEDYTVCNTAASLSNANSYDISDTLSAHTELEVDGCEGIKMTKFRRELVPSCFTVCSWPLDATKLEELIRNKFFGGDEKKCSIFLHNQGRILNYIRGAFVGLRDENIPFYELRHVQPIMKMFIEGMYGALEICDGEFSVAISQEMLVATFDDVSFSGRTDLEILACSDNRRAHIEAKRPFDQIFHTDGKLNKEELHIENEAIGCTVSSSTVVGFMFDFFVMWVSFRDQNGKHHIDSHQVKTKDILLRILLGFGNITEEDLLEAADGISLDILTVDENGDDNLDAKASDGNVENMDSKPSGAPQVGSQRNHRSGRSYTKGKTKNMSGENLTSEERLEMRQELYAWDKRSRREPLLALDNMNKL